MEKKNKGGRPIKEKKNEVWISCRVTVEEKKEIQKLAEKNNLTVSEVIIRGIKNKKIVSNKPELFNEFVKVNTELSKVGNNINQITKQINTMVKIGAIDPSIVNVIKLILEKHNSNVAEVKKELRKIYRDISKI